MTIETQGLREYFREPIKEIYEAAELLDRAVNAHLLGDVSLAESLIVEADIPAVWEWTRSIIGKDSPHIILRSTRELSSPLEDRIPVRMPNALEKLDLHKRDGHHCRFCGIPVIRREVREKIRCAYPEALRWGKRDADRHAAFFTMWVQYDHLVPHSKGGTNELNNIIITCTACNYGRGGHSLSEAGLKNPFERHPVNSTWDGLERFLRK